MVDSGLPLFRQSEADNQGGIRLLQAKVDDIQCTLLTAATPTAFDNKYIVEKAAPTNSKYISRESQTEIQDVSRKVSGGDLALVPREEAKRQDSHVSADINCEITQTFHMSETRCLHSSCMSRRKFE